MPLIDCILNLAGLLLWLNWLSPRLDPLVRSSAASLAGTLKKAEVARPQRWKFLAGLAVLLLFRGLMYWWVGPRVDWSPHLQLGLLALSFRSYSWDQMVLFSALGLALTLAAFYLWLLLLSIVNIHIPEKDPLQRLIRLHLGWVEKWPRAIKWLLPPLLAGVAWLALHPVFANLHIIPPARDRDQILAQALVFAASSYLIWKYLIVGILVLHMLNSYVYLGNSPFWLFLNQTARNLLTPLRWLPLRFGKADFAPLVAIALVFLLADFAAPKAFEWLYARLRL